MSVAILDQIQWFFNGVLTIVRVHPLDSKFFIFVLIKVQIVS
jgi:hypothetical protein